MPGNAYKVSIAFAALALLGVAPFQPSAAQVCPIAGQGTLDGGNAVANETSDPGEIESSEENGRTDILPMTEGQGIFSVLNIHPQGDGSIYLGWGNLGPTFVYTLEFSDSLTEPNWSAPPTSKWPTTVTNWTDTSASVDGMRFYRIKTVTGERYSRPGMGDQAPTFSLPNLDGNEVSIAGMIGKNTLIVVFWGTWCGHCRTEIPELERLHEECEEKGLRIVAAAVNDTASSVRQFVGDENITYTVLMDTKSVGLNSYSIIGVPTLFVVDLEGIIRYRGYSADEAEVIVKALLKM